MNQSQNQSGASTGVMRHAPTVARVLLGLVFFVFGLNGFLNFIPMPAEMPEKQAAFFAGMMATGYFFPLLKATEVVCGALLLANRYVPLALVVLAPIVVQIFAFHAFIAPEALPMAVVIVALEAYLGYAYCGAFRGVLQARAVPGCGK